MVGDVKSNSTETTENPHVLLERFVVENDDLLALESRIGRFNIFDALGIARKEIHHSNFLAFLLDPAESHGMGQLFLKAVLMDLLKSAPPSLRPLSPIDLDGNDLRGVTVKREWMHIDLLITSEDPAFAIVVENKIDSKEHSDQLKRYQQTMRAAHGHIRFMCVLLSADGVEPSEETWVSYRYADIHRVLARVRTTNEKAIGEDVLTFLDHYLNLLETRLMEDRELDELCRRIYKNHRQALDLIMRRAGSPDSSAFAAASDAISTDNRFQVLSSAGFSFDFVPKSWMTWLPPLGDGQNKQYWICAHLKIKGNSLVYIVFIGPMTDKEVRSRVIEGLREASPKLGLTPSIGSLDAKWARVTMAQVLATFDEDAEDSTVVPTLARDIDLMHSKLEQLGAVLKPMCIS